MGVTPAVEVLHVDDEPDFLGLSETPLQRESSAIQVRTATGIDEAMGLLETATVDCVVSDYDVPGTTGIEFLEIGREHPRRPPVHPVHRDGER
jgi:DNA-binding NtrC family response regulator